KPSRAGRGTLRALPAQRLPRVVGIHRESAPDSAPAQGRLNESVARTAHRLSVRWYSGGVPGRTLAARHRPARAWLRQSRRNQCRSCARLEGGVGRAAVRYGQGRRARMAAAALDGESGGRALGTAVWCRRDPRPCTVAVSRVEIRRQGGRNGRWRLPRAGHASHADLAHRLYRDGISLGIRIARVAGSRGRPSALDRALDGPAGAGARAQRARCALRVLDPSRQYRATPSRRGASLPARLAARLMHCAVIGAGAWGTALADLLARNGHEVALWAFEPDVVETVNARHANPRFLPGAVLSPQLCAHGRIERALDGAALVLLAAPSHVLRDLVRQSRGAIASGATLVVASKGIERGTLALMTQIVEQEAPRR